ncbi:MAG: hypothetical protein EOO36_12830 [Cytophagaceae bacterium]|nr:MAG: hypothetical protein EOO36_12830 [Cytophagaceae bacterium]
MPDTFAPLAMTSAHFVELLAQYLARFQHAASQLAEARLLARPTEDLTAALARDLLAYSWSVQSRALLRPAEAGTQQQQALELHLRLSVIETLVGLRSGQLPALLTAQGPDDTAPTPSQLQRLAAAEARVFHLYGAASLN